MSNRRKTTILLLVTFLFIGKINSQTVIGRQKVDQFTSTSWGVKSYALTWLPNDYATNTSQRYPLIIFLHGKGETGDGVWGLSKLTSTALPQIIANGWDPEAVNPVDGQTYKFIVVSPQSSTASQWSHQWSSIQYMLPEIISQYRVDTNRIYITGLSAGGHGTWSCLTSGPEAARKFAAAVPVAGAGVLLDSVPNVGYRDEVKVWQICGASDALMGLAISSTNYYNSLSPNPPAVLTSLPGGHSSSVWNTAYSPNWKNNVHGKNIYEWMLQYKRSGSSTTPPANLPPVVNAGQNQSVTLPIPSITLSGSANDPDGTITSYKWTQVSGPNTANIQNSTNATTLVSGLVAGNYSFRLTVTDNKNASASDVVQVSVAQGSSNPGRIKIEAEDYADMFGIQTEPTQDVGGGLNVGWQDDNDWMDYTVNLTASGNFTVHFRVASYFTGAQFQIKKADGTILKTLTVPNTGSFQSWTTITETVNLPAGQQTLRIMTSAANGGWNLNWIEFEAMQSAPNEPPVANAGADTTITLPVSAISISGSGSDPDGNIVSYLWSMVSGPSNLTFSNKNAASTQLSGFVEGVYKVRLQVTDNDGATATDDRTITVNPAPAPTPPPPPPPPTSIKIEAEDYVAMSGIQTENTSDVGGGLNVGWQDDNDWMDYSVNLSAAGSYTVSFRVASYFVGATFQLRNAAGAALATVTVPHTGTFQTWTTVSTQVTLPAGQQTLRIITTAANGGWNLNWWEIKGNQSTPNQPPTANAGADQTSTSTSVTLNGSGTDTDGTIASYAWSQVSGPNNATIASPNSASTQVNNLASGTYVFRLTVTDNSGAQATDDVTVLVTAAAPAYRIEAENFTAMNGIVVENTSDVGGGQHVAWQDNGDWMDYQITAPIIGIYPLRFRVSSPNGGGLIQIKNKNGSVLADFFVPKTGSYDNWTTVTTLIALPKGLQTLRVYTYAANGGWNFNWWEIATDEAVAQRPGVSVEEPTSVISSEAGQLQLYPNPTTDRVVVNLNNELTGKVQIQITDMRGATVRQFSMNKSNAGTTQFYLSIGDLPKGQYLLKLDMKDFSKASKIVRQ